MAGWIDRWMMIQFIRIDFVAHSEGDVYVWPFIPIEDLPCTGY